MTARTHWFSLIDLGYTNWVGPFYGLSARTKYTVNNPPRADNEWHSGDLLTVTGGPASMIGQRFRVS